MLIVKKFFLLLPLMTKNLIYLSILILLCKFSLIVEFLISRFFINYFPNELRKFI